MMKPTFCYCLYNILWQVDNCPVLRKTVGPSSRFSVQYQHFLFDFLAIICEIRDIRDSASFSVAVWQLEGY